MSAAFYLQQMASIDADGVDNLILVAFVRYYLQPSIIIIFFEYFDF